MITLRHKSITRSGKASQNPRNYPILKLGSFSTRLLQCFSNLSAGAVALDQSAGEQVAENCQRKCDSKATEHQRGKEFQNLVPVEFRSVDESWRGGSESIPPLAIDFGTAEKDSSDQVTRVEDGDKGRWVADPNPRETNNLVCSQKPRRGDHQDHLRADKGGERPKNADRNP